MTTEIYKGWVIEVAPAGQITITANDEATKEAYLSQIKGGKPDRISLFRRTGVLASAITSTTVEKVKAQIDQLVRQ